VVQDKPHAQAWIKLLRSPKALKDRYLLAEAMRRPRLLVPPVPKRPPGEPERG
jgi:hypothetical protein